MKTQNMKKAISLIVLVLTIVLMVILTAVTITSISNGGIFNRANIANFKSMVASMKEELVAYNANEMLVKLNEYYNIGEYNSKYLGADETSLTYKGTTIPNKNITDVLKSIKDTSYVSSFTISQGEIVYTGSDESLSAVASEILYNRSDVTTVNANGEISVTVTNASDEYLKDYNIYGNSEQDGIPTAAQPIPVYSLGEKNLFDKTFEYTTSPTFENAILLEAGQYVFSINSHSNATNWRIFKKIYDINGNDLTSEYANYFDLNYDNTNTHNYYNSTNGFIVWGTNYSLTSERINILQKCYISFGYFVGDTTETTMFSKIQLERGTTATDYVSYNAVNIKSSGKNLFNQEEMEFGAFSQSTGEEITGVALQYRSKYKIYCKEGDCFVQSNTKNWNLRAFWYASDDTFISSSSLLPNVAILAPANTAYMKFITGSGGISTELQLERGTTVTAYEPYQEVVTIIDLTGHEPLRKIGDVADYIDYANNRIVRNIGKTVFIGTEKLHIYDNGLGFMLLISDMKTQETGDGKCTHFETKSRGVTLPGSYCFIGANNNRVYFRGVVDVADTTVMSQKSYLELQYQAGTPVTIYYQLAETIYEAIELPQIPVYQNGIVTVTDASNVNAVYTQAK